MPYKTSAYFVMSESVRPVPNLNDPLFATVYDELTFWSSRFGALLFKHLNLLPGIEILDLGCATGFPSFELAQVHGASSRVFGVDIWKEAVIRAAARKRFFQLRNVELIAADASFLPFPKNRFDLIVSNLGLNNFVDPITVLAECHRVAKPHARMVITTNLQGHYREFYDVFRKVLRRLGKLNCFDKLAANEQHRGTQESVCRLMKDAGFIVARVISDEF
jgi:arsenite methyltransferase